MRIIECTMTVHFLPVNDIRRKALDVEERIKTSFEKPFSILPIPENAPVEYPRILAKTNGEHSTLIITKASVQIQTSFDNDYPNDFEKCTEYMLTKQNELYEIACCLSNFDCFFSGVTMKLDFDEWDNPVEQIYSKLFNTSNLKPYDLQTRAAYVIEDTYYINLDITNARHYTDVAQTYMPKLCSAKEVGSSIEVQIDVNDRYAYSYLSDYRTSKEKLNVIFDLLKVMVKSKIMSYLDTGVICFENI